MKKQFLTYARSVASVAKQLRLKGILSAAVSGAEFSQLIKPLGERILVISGHPGDEIMAMGGTLAWYAKQGIPVTILTVTAGLHGTNTGKLSKPLGPKRRKEELASLKILESDAKTVFWDLDEKFTPDAQLTFSLLDLIDELNPDIIYVPSLLDSHPDSATINQVLTEALRRLPSPRLKKIWLAQYELWTPIVPNKIFSIDAFESLKTKAIECHESQLLCRNYLDAMIGLNRYRAAMLGAGSLAEAFFVCRASLYGELAAPNGAPVIEMLKS